jgi:hypothetical protein
MKTSIALIAMIALPLSSPALAQRRVAVPMAMPDAALSKGSACSISSDGGSSSVDFSFGVSNPTSPATGAGRVKGSWDLATGKGHIVDETLRLITTPSSNGGPPIVVAHAINTKGAGGERMIGDGKQSQGVDFGQREASAPSLSEVACDHAINTKGTGASNGRAALEVGAIAGIVIACRINPGKGVTIFNPPPPPMPGKVSMQDFHFVSSSEASRMAGGPGGGPHVKVFECSSADGAPSSVSMLLLPAVQK